MSMTVQVIILVFLLPFTAAALYLDLTTLKLPNKLTVPAFFAGLIFNLVYGFWQTGFRGAFLVDAEGYGGLLFALGGFAVGFGILFILFAIGGAGGGDVKFMAAIGAWLGGWMTFQILIVGSLFASGITLASLARNVLAGKPGAALEKSSRQSGAKASRRSKTAWRVPFGVPAAIATWCLLGLRLAGYVMDWPPPFLQ